MSVPRPATQFRHHGLAHGHGTAGLSQLKRECLAILLRRSDGQAAVDSELGLHSRAFAQPEPAYDFGRNPQGKTVTPLRYL